MKSFALLVSGAFLCASSQATLNYFSLQYSAVHIQTSDAEPPASTSFVTTKLVTGTAVGEFLSGAVQVPIAGGRTDDLINIDGSYMVHYSSFQNTQAGLMAENPTGTYTFLVDRGAGVESAAMVNSAANFPIQTPYLTGGTFSNLQDSAPGVAQSVTWNPFTVPFGGSDLRSDFATTNYVTQQQDYAADGPAATFTGTTIPGSALKSGCFYVYVLGFRSYRNTGPGFGVNGTLTYERPTNGFFKVKAGPGTLSGQLILESTIIPYRKYYTVDFLDENDNVLDSQTILLGYESWYAATTTQLGAVKVRFDSVGYLSRVFDIPLLASGYDYLNVTLPCGDVNDDGEVGPSDFTALAMAFGSMIGDPNYNTDADFNNDNEVGPFDFTMLAANFGLMDE